MASISQRVGAAALMAVLSSSAFADYGRGYSQPSRHRGPVVRASGGDWLAPLLFIGLVGAALSASANNTNQPAPEPVYAAPPRMVEPPPVRYEAPAPPPAPTYTWYFCRSVGKYYPYTQYCPEGWQPVAATPQ